MTNGEAQTMAENSQPAGSTPQEAVNAESNAAAQAALAEQQPRDAAPMTGAEYAAMAAAAAAVDAPADQPAVELASAAQAQAEAAAKVKAEIEKEEEEKEGEEGAEQVADLAMDPGAEILEAVAAADGAREVPGAEGEGEALALGGEGGASPILAVAAVALMAAGVYIALDDGDTDLPEFEPEPEPEPEPENAAPAITSEATATVEENTDVGEVVYTVTATDADDDVLTYSLAGDQADLFTIDPETGEVFFVASPDFETQATYTVTVVATDPDGAADTQDVVFTITDVEDPTTTTVDLDVDDDGNLLTPQVIDAAEGDGDFLFTDDVAVGSNSLIVNFADGDLIQFSEGAVVSFAPTAEDGNDLQIIVNDNGVVSEIVLDEVLPDDAGFIFDEETAEAAVGFDFFSLAEASAETTAIAAENFA